MKGAIDHNLSPPHTRGDEPQEIADYSDDSIVRPTRVGMNRS